MKDRDNWRANTRQDTRRGLAPKYQNIQYAQPAELLQQHHNMYEMPF